jgi:hypothetical protein
MLFMTEQMNELNISAPSLKKNNKKKRDMNDDSGLSKNNSKSVKFRLRVQQDKEAEEELKEYDENGKRIS